MSVDLDVIYNQIIFVKITEKIHPVDLGPLLDTSGDRWRLVEPLKPVDLTKIAEETKRGIKVAVRGIYLSSKFEQKYKKSSVALNYSLCLQNRRDCREATIEEKLYFYYPDSNILYIGKDFIIGIKVKGTITYFPWFEAIYETLLKVKPDIVIHERVACSTNIISSFTIQNSSLNKTHC